MKLEEAENETITVYWWNCGKKTLDFKGPYKTYLARRGVKVTDIIHPLQEEVKGWRFEVSMSGATTTIDEYGYDYMLACNDIIKTFLLLMGDKAKLITPRGEFNINW